MHLIEQVSGRVGGATPVVGYRAVREVVVNLARVHVAAGTHEVDQVTDVPSARSRPRRPSAARMHQPLYGTRHETVVDEEVFVNVEIAVGALEIARTIANDAVPQREILGSCWCTDRIRLHEPQDIEGALERGRLEQTASDGSAPDVIERHSPLLSSRRSFVVRHVSGH